MLHALISWLPIYSLTIIDGFGGLPLRKLKGSFNTQCYKSFPAFPSEAEPPLQIMSWGRFLPQDKPFPSHKTMELAQIFV